MNKINRNMNAWILSTVGMVAALVIANSANGAIRKVCPVVSDNGTKIYQPCFNRGWMRLVLNENLKDILISKLDKKGQLSAGNELEVELTSNGETLSLRVSSYETNKHGLEVSDTFQSLVDIRIDI